MILGVAGLRLIKSFEGCRLAAYQDQRGIWTIGYGHTGPEVHEGLTCTLAQADAWLLGDTHTASRAVLDDVHVPITQNQFDALVSFAFNVGAGSLAHSTLLGYLNGGHTVSAAAEFLKWDHSGGVVDLGLIRRRSAEQALFLTP